MCGRFSLAISSETLNEYLYDTYQIENVQFDAVPRYNIAPRQAIIAVIFDGTAYRAGALEWGFLPPFVSKQKSAFRPINARFETAADKPYFKASFRTRRCLILADGFYEWNVTAEGKTPMRIQRNDHALFAMAGLYAVHTDVNGTKTNSATILTTRANELMAPIHERMPVMLDEPQAKIWLDSASDLSTLQQFETPFASKKMRAYPVSRLVNSPKNDVKACIEPQT